jgi:hypothetical protein
VQPLLLLLVFPVSVFFSCFGRWSIWHPFVFANLETEFVRNLETGFRNPGVEKLRRRGFHLSALHFLVRLLKRVPQLLRFSPSPTRRYRQGSSAPPPPSLSLCIYMPTT